MKLAISVVLLLFSTACSSATVDGGPTDISVTITEPEAATASAESVTVPADNDTQRVAETDPESAGEASSAVEAAGVSSSRTSDGLLAFYGFDEGGGDRIADSARSSDLAIDDASAVEWLDGALRINAPTVITSGDAPSSLIDGVIASGEITVEAWIETDNLDQSGPARIVSISGDTQNRNLTVGQGVHGSDGNFLDVRLRSTGTDNNGTPSLASPDGVLTTALTHIVTTRTTDGTTRLYFDGVLQSTGSAGGDLSNWDASYRLLLGNEATGDRPWLGTLHLVAIYDRAISEAEVAQNFSAGATG